MSNKLHHKLDDSQNNNYAESHIQACSETIGIRIPFASFSIDIRASIEHENQKCPYNSEHSHNDFLKIKISEIAKVPVIVLLTEYVKWFASCFCTSMQIAMAWRMWVTAHEDLLAAHDQRDLV